jgi:hypothetical protein
VVCYFSKTRFCKLSSIVRSLATHRARTYFTYNVLTRNLASSAEGRDSFFLHFKHENSGQYLSSLIPNDAFSRDLSSAYYSSEIPNYDLVPLLRCCVLRACAVGSTIKHIAVRGFRFKRDHSQVPCAHAHDIQRVIEQNAGTYVWIASLLRCILVLWISYLSWDSAVVFSMWFSDAGRWNICTGKWLDSLAGITPSATFTSYRIASFHTCEAMRLIEQCRMDKQQHGEHASRAQKLDPLQCSEFAGAHPKHQGNRHSAATAFSIG